MMTMSRYGDDDNAHASDDVDVMNTMITMMVIMAMMNTMIIMMAWLHVMTTTMMIPMEATMWLMMKVMSASMIAMIARARQSTPTCTASQQSKSNEQPTQHSKARHSTAQPGTKGGGNEGDEQQHDH